MRYGKRRSSSCMSGWIIGMAERMWTLRILPVSLEIKREAVDKIN